MKMTTLAELTNAKITKALENVVGYDERCLVCKIVVADTFNAENIKPESQEANDFFDDLNSEGCGFFGEEKKEIYKLMGKRK